MQAHFPDQTLASAASPHPEPDQNKVGHILYQTATVLAILVFLVSFWSC